MEYTLIILLQLLGIAFHVMQKVNELDSGHPEIGWQGVFSMFFKKDWDTLVISILIIILNVVVHFIIGKYAPKVAAIENYILYTFGLAFILGYAGQRLVYRLMGKAEGFLGDKIDKFGKPPTP